MNDPAEDAKQWLAEKDQAVRRVAALANQVRFTLMAAVDPQDPEARLIKPDVQVNADFALDKATIKARTDDDQFVIEVIIQKEESS